MQKIWIHKAKSWKDVKQFEQNYYHSMSAIQRLETIQYLREVASKIGQSRGQGRKRPRRIITVIQ